MKYAHRQESVVRETWLSERKKILALYILPGVLSILLSFLLYLPVLNRYFVSDDFSVLYRVCVERIIYIKNFFRPLSDISILMNYRLAGLSPAIFNAFNILVHGINSYLVYLTCLFFGNRFGPDKKIGFAVFSSLIFLTYPFHNEAVVWLLGRGASLACLFCLLSVVCYYVVADNTVKTCLVCVFYFISMSAFESALLFPILFISLLIFDRKNTVSLRNWTLFLSATLILHLYVRYRLAGSLMGTYGQYFFHAGIEIYFLNLAKTAGRLILPPTPHAWLITSVFFSLVALSAWFFLRNLKIIRISDAWRPIRFLSAMLLVSCAIPVVSGISTQTSETDRALYFPSVFLSMIIGLILVFGIKPRRNQLMLLLLILSYNVFFLEINNTHWMLASRMTESSLTKMMGISGTEQGGGKVYFLNIPSEIAGAYAFRQGFGDALRINRLDQKRFIAVNYLSRHDLEKLREKISVDPSQEKIQLPPDVLLRTDTLGCRMIYLHGKLTVHCLAGDRIFFWNMDHLEEIQTCQIRKPV